MVNAGSILCIAYVVIHNDTKKVYDQFDQCFTHPPSPGLLDCGVDIQQGEATWWSHYPSGI